MSLLMFSDILRRFGSGSGRDVLLTAFIVSVMPGVAAPAAAQVPRERPAYQFVFENDIFVGAIPGRPHSDREYTNGVWIATERSRAPFWGRFMGEIPGCAAVDTVDRTCLQTRFELGHKMFTPNIRAQVPPPTERPYAGWLYGATTARVAMPNAARSLRLELGVTGPPSLGEQFQRVIHVLTSYPEPRGWDYQLAFEPGVHVKYEEAHLLDLLVPNGRRIADAVLTANASVGNVRTGVQGGAKLRAGYRLPHPWARVERSENFAVFGETEYRRQWVARDLFLDGNTFSESRSVERIPTTDEWRYGVAVDVRDVRVQFTWVVEDPLYRTQPKPHRYGSLALTLRP